jgi:hypothetical protein
MIPHFLSKITVACVYSIAKMQKQADSLPNKQATRRRPMYAWRSPAPVEASEAVTEIA